MFQRLLGPIQHHKDAVYERLVLLFRCTHELSLVGFRVQPFLLFLDHAVDLRTRWDEPVVLDDHIDMLLILGLELSAKLRYMPETGTEDPILFPIRSSWCSREVEVYVGIGQCFNHRNCANIPMHLIHDLQICIRCTEELNRLQISLPFVEGCDGIRHSNEDFDIFVLPIDHFLDHVTPTYNENIILLQRGILQIRFLPLIQQLTERDNHDCPCFHVARCCHRHVRLTASRIQLQHAVRVLPVLFEVSLSTQKRNGHPLFVITRRDQ